MQVVRRVGETWHGHRLILFGFLSQSSKTKAMAAMPSVAHARTAGRVTPSAGPGDLAGFRREFYTSLTARADALFELTDAVLCADGPVTSLVELTLAAEHRRGHGAMYDALTAGRVEPERLRRALASLPLPTVGGRIVLAVDVSPWLRPDAPTSADRLFCHVYGRAKDNAQLIPGWPYSFVAALETGRTSWTAVLDAVRLGPADDATAVTADPAARRGRPADHGRALAARRPADPDRGRRRLRHHPARLRAGRPARGAARAAALGPGPAPAQACAACRGRPAAHPSTARRSPWTGPPPGPSRSTPPAPRPPATAWPSRPAGIGCTRG